MEMEFVAFVEAEALIRWGLKREREREMEMEIQKEERRCSQKSWSSWIRRQVSLSLSFLSMNSFLSTHEWLVQRVFFIVYSSSYIQGHQHYILLKENMFWDLTESAIPTSTQIASGHETSSHSPARQDRFMTDPITLVFPSHEFTQNIPYCNTFV